MVWKSIESRRGEIHQVIQELRHTLTMLEERCSAQRNKFSPRERCILAMDYDVRRLKLLVRGLNIAEGIQNKRAEVGG